MKTPKELDIVRRHEIFDDTPLIVKILEDGKMPEIARHVHKMHIYQKHLVAEIRKLRRELKFQRIDTAMFISKHINKKEQ